MIDGRLKRWRLHEPSMPLVLTTTSPDVHVLPPKRVSRFGPSNHMMGLSSMDGATANPESAPRGYYRYW